MKCEMRIKIWGPLCGGLKRGSEVEVKKGGRLEKLKRGLLGRFNRGRKEAEIA